MSRRLSRIGIAGAIGLGLLSALPAAALQLTPDEMRILALQMIDAGRPEAALQIAEALLQQEPADHAALVAKARALRDLGRNDASIETARAAWRAGRSQRARFGAALAMAQGLASGGNRLAAKIWLARAVDLAPDAMSRQIAEQDLAYVRSRARLSLTGSLSIAPSSNLNGGSEARVLNFLGIPLTLSPDARPLSGTEATGAIGLRWRFAEGEVWTGHLDLGIQAREVRYSAQARALAPLASEDEQSHLRLSAGISLEQVAQGPGLWRLSGQVVHFDVARRGYSDGLRLSVSREQQLDHNTRATLSVAHQATRYGAGLTTRWHEISAELARDLGNGDRIGLVLSGEGQASSAGTGRDFTGQRIEVSYDFGPVNAWMDLKASLALGWRHHPVAAYQPGPRHDRQSRVRLEAGLTELRFLGMTPVLSVDYSATQSNVPLLESRDLSAGFSLRTQF